jgi:hypothetical protein
MLEDDVAELRRLLAEVDIRLDRMEALAERLTGLLEHRDRQPPPSPPPLH